MNPMIQSITQSIVERSKPSRQKYLQMVDAMRNAPPAQDRMSCSNWAHVVAANSAKEKNDITTGKGANIGIVTAYNDMLSAHQPFANYPQLIKLVARSHGATAQVAGGVPAMCDGVTQGQPGMELSLLSRDVIAMATAVSLSHDVYDAVICLGVCDKIVPGMLIGALQFGHLPIMFVPAGPMPSGISNKEKAEMRQKFAAGEVDKAQLLQTESASYHSPGTCTFYGTANTNQVIMEVLGLQLAGTSFVNPNTPLRQALTEQSVIQLLQQTSKSKQYCPIAEVVNEQSIVNAIVCMMATGGSTNLTLHLIAISAAAGIQITWQDMDAISRVTPLLARVYPNGQADINQFEQAGGLAYIISQLRTEGLLNEAVRTVMGEGLESYQYKPSIHEEGGNKKLVWENEVTCAKDTSILSTIQAPFATEGGMRLVQGNLGQAVVKVSAVQEKYHKIEAPCVVFSTQEQLREAFERGELEKDFIAVVRFQGPQANGMPELHKLTPYLGILQDKGYKVALVTDGRMSGASGKVLVAMHVSPEAQAQGNLARVQTGDRIRVDAKKGELQLLITEQALEQRAPAQAPKNPGSIGRGIFASSRANASTSTTGASFLSFYDA